MAETYCRQCGRVLTKLHWFGTYDPQTGEKQTIRVCADPRCRAGCVYAGGHIGFLHSLGLMACRRCGHRVYGDI